MIIDAHCHASPCWYEPVDSLLATMDRNGVDRAVLVQVLGSYDHAYMAAATATHPDRFSFVAAVDPYCPAPLDAFRRLIDDGARGVRIRADQRVEAPDPLVWWRAAAAEGLAVSVAGPASAMLGGAVDEVARALPDLPLILEHLGGLARPDASDRATQVDRLCALASHRNVWLKLPGLGQLAPRLADIAAADPPLNLTGVDVLLARIAQAFGSRLLWGSDFPPVSAREGYGNALNWPRALAEEAFSQFVADWFGGSAEKLFFGQRR